MVNLTLIMSLDMQYWDMFVSWQIEKTKWLLKKRIKCQRKMAEIEGLFVLVIYDLKQPNIKY